MSATRHIMAKGAATVDVESRLELARWSTGNELLFGAGLSLIGLYAVWWMYRREARGRVSPSLRRASAACRILVLLTLGFIGLEPVLVQYEQRRIEAQTIVLIDESSSMGLRDHYPIEDDARRVEEGIGAQPADGLQRSKIAESLLTGRQGGLLHRLAMNNNVRILSFSDTVKSLGSLRRSGSTNPKTFSVEPDAGPREANSAKDDNSLAPLDLNLNPVGSATDL